MRWLLDTNVVSEFARSRPNRAVLNWIARQPDELVTISAVTLAELQVGLATADDRKRAQLESWLERAVSSWFGERILPVSVEILKTWLETGRGLAAKGMTCNPADLLIAATAHIHNLTVVSRNARDFAGTGVVVHDPWSGKTHHTEMV